LRSDLLQSVDTAIGVTIIAKIIPAVRVLQGMFPILIDATFPPSMLAIHNLPSQIDCADIAVSDQFFDSIIFKYAQTFIL
jgi:hypothetical protein